jgi:hypothetical protein
VDSYDLAQKFRQRLLVPWMAFLSLPVLLSAATFFGYGFEGVLGDVAAKRGLDAALFAGAVSAVAVAHAVLRWKVGCGIGRRASMVDLSGVARWWCLRIDSAKDLDVLRSAVDLMAPRVIAWFVAVAAFTAGTVYSREIGARVLTAAATVLILFMSRP